MNASKFKKARALLERATLLNNLSMVGSLFGVALIAVSIWIENSVPVLYTGATIIYLSLAMTIYSRRLLKRIDRMLRDN
jgi:hypothetical protein